MTAQQAGYAWQLTSSASLCCRGFAAMAGVQIFAQERAFHLLGPFP
jgi:hypothetical protein